MNTKNLYAFTLGREWKLSLAELIAVFWNDAYESHSESIAFFHIVGYSPEQLGRKFLTLWGSIRIIAILDHTTASSFPTDVISIIENGRHDGKIHFALGAYETEFRLSDIGLRIKKTLSERHISARLINGENLNINAASFKKEKLAKSGNEYNLIASNGIFLLGRTIACQDIDAYAARDTGKSRDMIVGMMPPKLTQMMINLAIAWLREREKTEIHLYDPFCGLGTTLIEWANMGITHIFGSDISRDMVDASSKSLDEFIKTEIIWQERIKAVGGTPNKDFSKMQKKVIELNAERIADAEKRMWTTDFTLRNTMIVSEWYLGEIMSPRDISLEKVQSERKKLASLYNNFFAGLSHADFRSTIVMSFPFWNIHGTYSYFTEIYDIIEKHGFMVDSLLPGEMGLNTRKWSLLYRRENQTVGREIIRIMKM